MKYAPRSISQLLFRLIFFRLYLPLLVLIVLSVIGVIYVSTQNLIVKQYQVSRTLALLVQYHVEQGGRILSAVGKSIDKIDANDAGVFLSDTFDAYGYFETLYFLDEQDRIKILEPKDSLYMGIDLSRLPQINSGMENNGVVVSRSYISGRTGEPTVLLSKRLPGGGRIAGELRLGLLQREVANTIKGSIQETLFVADQNGKLLAHPQFIQVQQQNSFGNHYLLQQKINNTLTSIYRHEGRLVIGTASRIPETGWVVVDQISLKDFVFRYALVLASIVVIAFSIWALLWWSGHRKLQQQVVLPLENLIQKTKALTNNEVDFEVGLPGNTAFNELVRLDADFREMCRRVSLREQALRESELRYRGLFDQVPVGLFRVDFSGRFLDVNPAFVKLLGYPDRETLLSKSFFDVLYSTSQDNVKEQIRVEDNFVISGSELFCKRFDGVFVWLLLNGQCFVDQKQGASICDGSIQDITERKNAEEMLRRLNDELELTVEKRTLQLSSTNELLQQEIQIRKIAEIELIERNREILEAHRHLQEAHLQIIRQEKMVAIGQLAAGMAHEVNDPLAFMVSNIELLRLYQQNLIHFVSELEKIIGDIPGLADSAQEELYADLSARKISMGIVNVEKDSIDIFVDTMAYARRIMEVVKNLMALSKDSKGLEVADVNMALDGVLANIQNQVDENISITWLLEPLPQTFCNVGQLYQVFWNLILNAVQAIDGSGEIHVHSRVEESQIVVSVTDSGCGIPQDIQSRIFEPFFTTRDTGNGRGLGLSVADDIVKQHKGVIEVSSVPGEGATFTVRLPIVTG